MFTIHYQTDLGALSGEPAAARVLEELEQHYSTSGTSLNVWTSAMRADCVITKTRVREEVAPGSGDIPAQAENVQSKPGLISAVAGDKLPIEVCVWIKLTSDVASRSSRGGLHLPPQLDPTQLDSNGRWQASWLAGNLDVIEAAIVDTLDDVFPEEVGNASLIPVIYSKTRRARGQSPFTFQITHAVSQDRVRWLRRRGIAP
jgi:hypothetical protein